MKQKIYLKLVFMIIALVFFAFHFSSALACVASRDPRFNYFISYERPHSGMFRDGNEATEIRPTIVDHCEQSPGQFLMVALALRTSRINGRTADISFVKKLNDDSCHLRNNPFPESQGFQERFAHFNHQFDLLRACAYYDISEINGNDIELPDLQPAARIDRVDHRHIRAQGDFVFVKINRNSRFAIGVGLKQECMDRNFLKQMHLEPSELQALLNTYVSGDSSGSSTDLMPIGSSRVRFVLAAGSDLMPVGSMDQRVESPSWPVTFKTGVEFGSLSIHSQNDSRLKIDFAPLVDHFARTRCVNGICSVENSFSAPIAGLVELVDLGRSRNRVFDSWYFGASAPGQYQGFVESVSRYLDAGLMSVGKRYSIEMTMVEPEEDYSLFLNNIQQLLINLNPNAGVPGADQIQSLGQLSELTGLSQIKGFGQLSGGDWKQQIDAAISELSKTRISRGWPGYFDQTCLGKNGKCFKRGQVKFIKKIGAKFTLGKKREDDSHELENLVIFRADPGHGYQETTNAVLPTIDCTEARKP